MFQQQQFSTASTSEDAFLCEVTSKLENSLEIEKKPPHALICSICNNLMTDPVIMSCCANTFCENCASTTINNMNDAVCPGDGCDKIVGFPPYIYHFILSGVIESWLQRSGSEEGRSPTPKIPRIKLAPVDNCPPPSLKCPICTNLMTECGIMHCCGSTFCTDCIANIVSSLREPVCPGAGCNNKNVGCGSYSSNFPLQHAAQTWFSRVELLNSDRCEYEQGRENRRQICEMNKKKRKASGDDEEFEIACKIRSVNSSQQELEVIYEDIQSIIRADHHTDKMIVD